MSRRNGLIGLGIVAALAGAPLLVQSGYHLHLLVTVGLFVIMGTGFDLLNGRLGLLFLAPAAFFGFGTYTISLLEYHFDATFFFPLSLVIGGGVALLIAYVMSYPLLRLSSHMFAMATLAFALAVEILVVNWVDVTRGPMCVAGLSGPSLSLDGKGMNVVTPAGYFYLALAVAVASVLAYKAIVTSRIGRTFSAIRQNENLAAAQGIPVMRYKRLGLMLTAFSCGVSGAFAAQYTRVTCPDDLSTFYVTLNLLVIAYIGGLRNLPGTIIGALGVVIIPELFRISSEARMVLYGAVLLAVAIFTHEGVGPMVGRYVKKAKRQLSKKGGSS